MVGTPPAGHQANRSDHDAFRPVEILILLILAIVAIICLDMLFYASTLEDAYITFRYSEHLADGYGLGAWNIEGERVEGYTTFLWMVLLGAAHALEIDVRTAAKTIGILMHLVLCSTLIAFPLLRRGSGSHHNDIFEHPNEAVLAGVFLAFYLPLSWYATSGMETLLFSTLTGLAIVSIFLRQSRFSLPLLSILLVLTRPEGLVIAGAAIALDFITRRREGRSVLSTYISAGAVVFSAGFLIVHRLIYFGDIVPNSYWAKVDDGGSHHIFRGLRYVGEWATENGIVAFLCVVAVLSVAFSLVRTRYRNWPWGFGVVLCMMLAFVAFIIKTGGDNYSAFPYWRHFVHLSAPIAFLSVYAVVRLRPHSRFFHVLVLLVVLFVTNLSILRAHDNLMVKSIKPSLASYPSLTHAEHDDYLLRLKWLSQSDAIVASSLGGELPYVVDAIHIDILGLNTPHIAKCGSFDPDGPVDSKTDMKWVLEQHPDIIEGYIPGTMVLNATPSEMKEYIDTSYRSKMNKELVSSGIFQRDYLFVRNWPYQVKDRAIFIRRSYWVDCQVQDELDCVPVADTPLGVYAKDSDNN
ncbi:MAG: hypothetical protein ABIJ00_04485 [Candidatus Eisenbacteria bacterium]